MKIGIARIYYGGGRRYLTLRGACQAEAKARVKAHYRKRNGGYFLDDIQPPQLPVLDIPDTDVFTGTTPPVP